MNSPYVQTDFFDVVDGVRGPPLDKSDKFDDPSRFREQLIHRYGVQKSLITDESGEVISDAH